MEPNLVDAIGSLLPRLLPSQCPAEGGHDSHCDEKYEVEDVHDGGKGVEPVELVGVLVHQDRQDACVHGDCEP